MNITINGTNKNVTSAGTLSDIVKTYCKYPKGVITELNGNIIPSALWPQTKIQDGDTLELVAFVGGG
ncbi:MAG: sulfur carrier protein ThiS [Candidatus Omnitrophica bacterium]|nr:sulfur carrier protein ThiS [Candidatus Omnitrophota bacterium]MDE2222092.1 sulfur carrier protein ThiS [Candidatus Omnitrophota bacterium]